MRKGLIFVLVLVLVLSGFSTAFAADTTITDVRDTVYEKAVTELIKKGVIAGYPDGTFRPGDTISRAEACVIAAASMNPSDQDLAGAAGKGFPDLSGYEWAIKYINYGAAKGFISGYPDGTFRPGDQVTYNEMAAMLVRALGYQTADLSGTWPTNFISKAEELGILSGIKYIGNAPAPRGDVALMDYSVVDKIAEINAKPAPEPETPSPESDYAELAGPLAEFSGRAFGMFLDAATVLNADSDAVEQIEFLFGDSTLYINTNGKFSVGVPDLNGGDLYGLQMNGGIVRKIGDSSDDFLAIGSPAGFEDFGITQWAQVIKEGNGVVTVTYGGIGIEKSILDDASIYVATTYNISGIGGTGTLVNGYEPGTLADIDVGDWVRLYSVTGDNPGCVEVVVISNKKIGVII